MTEDTVSSTHPPLPPTTEDNRISWLRLLRSRRVGPTTFHRLMAEHGSADAALAALPDVAKAAGVENYAPCPVGVARAELEAGRAAGAHPVFTGCPDYPAALFGLPDAPPILWVLGDTKILERPLIALVGARNASSLGLRMAKGLAAELTARGFVVVSGLARGIDTAAHLAALDAGTIAVVAGGVDVMYPAENTRLAQDIVEKGGLRVSEQPLGMVPQARHFPARNRIISGMCRGVVVIEAAAKSGSLITARTALDQGREVLAVPGHPFDARASGCNMLIRDGAALVRNAADVIEALPEARKNTDQVTTGPSLPDMADSAQTQPPRCVTPQGDTPRPVRSLRETAALHGEILNRLGPSPLAEDQLIRDMSQPAAKVAPLLTDLELEGRIKRHPGGLVSLNA